MDPISQGALGAVAAGCLASRENFRTALLLGGLGAMAADLDVLIRSVEDPLRQIEFHRHFTHSLIFVPIGGVLMATLFWPFVRRRMGFWHLFLCGSLGYGTAGLLDACTSYGTQLYWPFSDERVAWNLISIVDPFFTVPLVLFLWFAFRKRWWLVAPIGLCFAVGYLQFGKTQRDRAYSALDGLIEARGHDQSDWRTVKPSFGNLLVWRGMYRHEGKLRVDAIRVPYWDSKYKIYEGEELALVSVDPLLGRVPEGSAVAEDLRRFEHFSDGYIVWHPDHERVLGDARYSVLPNKIRPLWGISVDFDQPDRHGAFMNYRGEAKEQGMLLWRMVLGRDQPDDS